MFNNINLKPMLLKEIKSPFTSKNYLYEIKFDGIRVFIHAKSNSIKIVSRNNKDITNFFPELEIIKKVVGTKKVIFDGEIIAVLDGKPNFQLLQKRLHTKNIQNDIKIAFIAFDLIYENKDLTNYNLTKRKKLLNKYKDNALFIKSKIFNDGKKLFKEIQKLNLEGIVAKDKKSSYYLGKRTDLWLKIKNIKEDYFYIHGLIFNHQKWSILLGEYHSNKFYYVGKISVPKNHQLILEIKNLKKQTCKFCNYYEEATYYNIEKKVLVSFLEKTKNGLLRAPSLKSFRINA